MNRSFRLSAVALVALFALPAGKSLGQNVTYTYTIPSTSGTVDWSTGPNWAGSTAPVSSATTALVFTGSMSASEVFLSNNNTSGTFTLNYLQFTGSAGNNTPMLTISGNPLSFSGASPRISVSSGTTPGGTGRPQWISGLSDRCHQRHGRRLEGQRNGRRYDLGDFQHIQWAGLGVGKWFSQCHELWIGGRVGQFAWYLGDHSTGRVEQ